MPRRRGLRLIRRVQLLCGSVGIGVGIDRPPPERLADLVGHFDETSRDDERALGRRDDSSGQVRMLEYTHGALSGNDAKTMRIVHIERLAEPAWDQRRQKIGRYAIDSVWRTSRPWMLKSHRPFTHDGFTTTRQAPGNAMSKNDWRIDFWMSSTAAGSSMPSTTMWKRSLMGFSRDSSKRARPGRARDGSSCATGGRLCRD